MAASKRVILAAFICVACAANASTDARAQVRMELTPTTEIPRSYKSWSLFLICNPAWIVENGDKGIEELFHRYKAFGESIGPNNLAIWFWRKPAVAPTSDNTDISRSAVYCEKYKLLPSESPHVLVTTRHPDDQDPGDRLVVSLNGLDAHDSALAITKLADQLVATGLSQSGLDNSDRGGAFLPQSPLQSARRRAISTRFRSNSKQARSARKLGTHRASTAAEYRAPCGCGRQTKGQV
jgi:hypothetical protein